MVMSEQSDSLGVALNLSDAQQNFRLLELPEELVESLALPDPPRLCFKSSTSATATALSAVSKSAGNLHLCTPTQAYQVRQVSTSNSVYILRPSDSEESACRHGDGDGSSTQIDDDHVMSSSAMTAIAKTDSILELLPIAHDVTALLEHLLPLCDPEDFLSHEEMESFFLTHSSPGSKAEMLAEIPAPNSRCEDAWQSLLAFELDGRIARSGLRRALAIYELLVEFYRVQNHEVFYFDRHHEVNLDTFCLEINQFVEAEEITKLDAAILKSVLRHLNDDSIQDLPDGSYSLERFKTVQWTGRAIILAGSNQSPHYVEEIKFLVDWHALVPARWATDVVRELPLGAHRSKNSAGFEVISFHQPDEGGQNLETLQVASAQQEKKSEAGGKRKWHEKFKAQRKEVKK